VVFFLLFPVFLNTWSVVEICVTGSYTGTRSADEHVRILLLFLAFALFFGIVQYRRLRFYEFKIPVTAQQFHQAIERTASELQWRIDKKNDTFLRASRPFNWSSSWGEMVTIIRYKDHLLINSICDPDLTSSLVSYGWNRKNINTFLKNTAEVLNNKPAGD